MFNEQTGVLTFDRPQVSIGPSLTRDEFLLSSLAEGATTLVQNEPHHAWKLGRCFQSLGIELLVALVFRDQELSTMSLMDADPRFGTSWDDASYDKEMARKDSHDVWLSSILPPRGEFLWGKVWSAYDDKGGFSCVIVNYAEATHSDMVVRGKPGSGA